MSTPIDAVAPPIQPQLPTQAPTDTDGYADGQAAADDLLELVPVDVRHGEAGEVEALVEHFSDDVRGPLERAATDPDFAAGLVEGLGPEGFSRLVAAVDRIPLRPDTNGNDNGETATEFLSLLGQALGSATRMPGGPIDPAFVSQITENDGYTTGDELDPELAAILLNQGDYTPETAAMLGAHVFLEADPPRVYDRPDGYIDTSAHRAPLLTPAEHNVEFDNVGAWATATHGILRNSAASELVALRDSDGNPIVAQRLLDPALADDPTTVMNPLTGAILDTPRGNLSSNPHDPAALSAVEAMVEATHDLHGNVGEWGREPLAQLYMAYTGEILNIGEGRDGFPASASPLGERLANLPADLSGAGADIVTAALGTEGTPPVRLDAPTGPMWPSAERYDSWQTAIYAATDRYRGLIQTNGPQAGVDVEDIADEVSDIDAELVQGQFGADAIVAAGEDDDNAARQNAVNVATDYIALGLGFGAGGGTRAVFANAYNAHAESPLLERLWPTDNAAGVFHATVPEFAQRLVAAQAVQIVEASARNGLIELPASLRDPATGGLRTPTSDADGERFAEDLANFIEGNDVVGEAVDGAAANLMARVNAMGTGAYRGGG